MYGIVIHQNVAIVADKVYRPEQYIVVLRATEINSEPSELHLILNNTIPMIVHNSISAL